MASVNICGVPYKIESISDTFGSNSVLGQISYADATIHMNSDLTPEMYNQTLIHEVIHGMFVHLGYNDLSDNEVLVSSLATAIDNTFKFKEDVVVCPKTGGSSLSM